MSHLLQLIILILLLPVLAACQDPGGDDIQAGSDSTMATAALFDKEMSKAGCELLSAEVMGATFDVPADGLTQYKIMGCRYSWDNDTETLEGGISMIRVYESEAAAASWYANATRNKTAEEMQAEMEKISRRLEQSEELDTDLKKSAAKSVLASVGSKAEHFEDVPDVGDEARVNDDGTVFVRVGNLTFMASAYKGPKAPPIDLQGVDLNQMVKVANEHAAQWAIHTAPQRKVDGARLAQAIVGEL